MPCEMFRLVVKKWKVNEGLVDGMVGLAFDVQVDYRRAALAFIS